MIVNANNAIGAIIWNILNAPFTSFVVSTPNTHPSADVKAMKLKDDYT